MSRQSKYVGKGSKLCKSMVTVRCAFKYKWVGYFVVNSYSTVKSERGSRVPRNRAGTVDAGEASDYRLFPYFFGPRVQVLHTHGCAARGNRTASPPQSPRR